MKRISFFTLGCKLNQYETEALVEEFEREGFEIVPFGEPTDICVVNTCTVTSKSDCRSRQILRKIKNVSPYSTVIATGCYAQRNPELLANMESVDLVVGMNRKSDLMNIVRKYPNGPDKIIGAFEDIPGQIDKFRVKSFRDHTRAFLKIQDGCNRNCSYCVVRIVRGPSRSKDFEAIIDEALSLKDMGYREVVLTGVHIGDYGLDTGESELLDLMEALEEMEGEMRFRLSSLDPMEISPDMVSFLKKSRKFCRHVHISVQSGDDSILKTMNRSYSESDIKDTVTRLQREIPGIAIGADFIVGFPGESEESFLKTYRLVVDLPFSYLHVFRFSPREGTSAAGMGGQVTPIAKKERSSRLIELGKAKREKFISSFIDRELETIVESKDHSSDTFSGLTDNYIKVICKENSGTTKKGMLAKVRIERVLNFKQACGTIVSDRMFDCEKS